MNLPNKLTVARFIMALAFVGLMSLHHTAYYVLAYLLFIAATLTDYYDGKIARARNIVTNFGKLLDPVADKVLVVGALIMLMAMPELRLPGWTVVVIIAREFLITGARALAASGGSVIGANIWGKTKAVIQMVYVFVFLAAAVILRVLETHQDAIDWLPALLSYTRPVVAATSCWAIVFVAVFTIYSGVHFMRVNWDELNMGSDL